MSERCSAARWVAFGFVPLLLFSACASSVPAPDLMKHASAEATQYLEAGDYQGALNVLKAQLREYPGNREWAAEVAAALDEIHGIAESAFRRQNYARADRIYRMLLDHYDDFERAAVRLTFQKSDLEAGVRNCRAAIIDTEAGQALKSSDPAKALDVYAAAFKGTPGDKDIAARYLRTVQEVKAAGDKALAGKDYALAGKLHWALLQRYPVVEGLALRPPVGKPDLEAVIALCRENLTKAGLVGIPQRQPDQGHCRLGRSPRVRSR